MRGLPPLVGRELSEKQMMAGLRGKWLGTLNPAEKFGSCLVSEIDFYIFQFRKRREFQVKSVRGCRCMAMAKW